MCFLTCAAEPAPWDGPATALRANGHASGGVVGRVCVAVVRLGVAVVCGWCVVRVVWWRVVCVVACCVRVLAWLWGVVGVVVWRCVVMWVWRCGVVVCGVVVVLLCS